MSATKLPFRRRAVRSLMPAILVTIEAGGVMAQGPPPTDADFELYLLAVDSAAYPDESVVLLLNERALHIDVDGTLTRRVRVVRQILKEAAVAPSAELSFGYDPTRETFALDWARVVEKDGTIVAHEPVHVQELDEPVARNAPVYSSRKRVRASLGNVTVGRIVDWQYTVRVVDPPLPGDIWVNWDVNLPSPVRRSRFTLEHPVSLRPRIRELNLPAPARIREERGMRISEWAYDDVAPFEREQYAGTPNSVRQTVTVSGDLDWDDIARWYNHLAESSYDFTPELEARLSEVVAGASTLTDSIEAVYRWVAQDIRYASISLGRGGYQPRPAGEVLATGVGDCKDKTTLFLSLVARMGVEGYPVVVSTGRRVQPDLPSIRQFNHMVAAIKPEDEWVYLDLTVRVSPYGEVFGPHQGRTGVLFRPDGTANVMEFPKSAATENRSSIVVEGALSEDGGFEGTYTETVTGAIQYRIRAEFYRALSPQRRASVARNLGQRIFEGASADSVELFVGRDLSATPRLWGRIHADNVLRELPGGWMLPLKLPRFGSAEGIARLEEDADRQFPIDVERVFGRREHYSELRIILPEGWVADLPSNVTAESRFGQYESSYQQSGRELVVRRRMLGYDGLAPPERYQELIDWLKATFGDDAEYIVLTPPPGA